MSRRPPGTAEDADSHSGKGFLSALLTLDESEAVPSDLPFELRPLSVDSLQALQRLARYKAPRDTWPMKRRAAVMIALFASRHGHLNVLLTTRSSTMRTYAGETALPGGKLESTDLDLEYTARREAYEECGLPMDYRKVRRLTTLQPFLSRGNLIVTPVVCFITDQTITPNLNAREVSHLFSHPLPAFLMASPPHYLMPDLPVSVQENPTMYMKKWQFPWFSEAPYRLFAFRSKASPIVGFTADVLIEAATVAYARTPEFERFADGQLPMRRIIELALWMVDEFKSAKEIDLIGDRRDLLEDEDNVEMGSGVNNKRPGSKL